MAKASLWIRLTACVCITILELTALLKGVNGVAFGLAVAAIGTIAGTTLKPITQFFKAKDPPQE